MVQKKLECSKQKILIFAENDQLFPDEVREAGQKYLVDKQVEHEIKLYPGVPHGNPQLS